MGNHARTAAAVIAVGLCAAAVGGCSNSGGTKSTASKSAAVSTPAASGSSSPAAPASPSKTAAATATVAAASSPLGTILVDGKGRTLYLWVADTTSKSNCSGECAKEWPPLTVSGEPVAGKGVKAGLLGTTKRGDGSREVTYNGHPLYYFAGDRKAGESNGQGVNDSGAKWYVLDTSGNKVLGTAKSGTPQAGSLGDGR
ncbi:hypothetical protein ACFWOJ_25985 [Streptomyces sp. NPDC058439]|uniref:COG4315 family predicted lipoprotein n=1 Tax=Streptomyces sp. NPDC058439 TaxID=3346500 RepID=UPI00365349C5